MKTLFELQPSEKLLSPSEDSQSLPQSRSNRPKYYISISPIEPTSLDTCRMFNSLLQLEMSLIQRLSNFILNLTIHSKLANHLPLENLRFSIQWDQQRGVITLP